VLLVACLTEDRTGDEQRAMLDLALKVDKERASFSALNPNPPEVPTLTFHVERSYEPSEGRRVGLTGAQREQLKRLHEKFTPCAACGVRQGEHALQCLSADIERHRAECGAPEGQLL